MDRGVLGERIAALRAECAALGAELVEGGRSLSAAEGFELAGELQGVLNAVEGAQAVAAAWAARVEERPGRDGVVERVHPVGYVDAMASTMVCLHTSITEGLAGRKVRLGAALAERFPTVLASLVAGEVASATAQRVVDACDGLDVSACRLVDERVGPRLAGLDPAAVTRTVRGVAARVAADQVAARAAKTRRGRCVEVTAADDGLSQWWALLPTATAAAAWSAVEQVAAEYRAADPELSVPESRADAFGDLLLRNVTVQAKVTLGVPVIAGDTAAGGSPEGGWSRQRVDLADDDVVHVDHASGLTVRAGDLDEAERERLSWVQVPDADHPCGGGDDSVDADPRYAVGAPLPGGSCVSGTELPGIGWVDAGTVAAMFTALPIEVARAVLDAGTGTLVSTTTAAYVPPRAMREFVHTRDGTCRMWGCTRRAERTDLDHTRPWPTGPTSPRGLAALCRRHHRMKQLGRWRYTLHPDGTIDWVDHTGRRRRTEPVHRMIPPTPSPSPPLEPEPALTAAAVAARTDPPPY